MPIAKWPVYWVENDQNYVFDANVTGSSYIETELFRAGAMQYCVDNFVTLFGRQLDFLWVGY